MRPKYYANQILRGKTPLSLEDQREDFKLYASMQREPMKFVKHKGRDVRVPRKWSLPYLFLDGNLEPVPLLPCLGESRAPGWPEWQSANPSSQVIIIIISS